jgi:hypothetical protein
MSTLVYHIYDSKMTANISVFVVPFLLSLNLCIHLSHPLSNIEVFYTAYMLFLCIFIQFF